ncbi:hypothetical protein TNCV_5042821 [Trichonephila clavipes]|nr:hypothetical protein TNCV_5042821 [Trichonephila clavipes]
MGNPGMTGDSTYTGTGSVLFQIHHSLLVAWRSYHSHSFFSIDDEGSTVGQSLGQVRKECFTGLTLVVQPLCAGRSYRHISRINDTGPSTRVTTAPRTELT